MYKERMNFNNNSVTPRTIFMYGNSRSFVDASYDTPDGAPDNVSIMASDNTSNDAPDFDQIRRTIYDLTFQEYNSTWHNIWDRGGSSNVDSNYSYRYGKPTFSFVRNHYLRFNAETDDFFTVCTEIILNPGKLFVFDFMDKDGCAYGPGANKQVYYLLSKQISQTIMTVTDNYFMDVNPSHFFWADKENIKCFVTIIAMIVNSDCYLPYHLPPALLEAITHKKMILSELEFFMDKSHEPILKAAQKVTSNDFSLLDTDYDDHADLYRHFLVGEIDEAKNKIYHAIATNFEFFDAMANYDILTVDEVLSGPYHITNQQVLKIIDFTSRELFPLWEKFILSLTESELNNMLILFGNTKSLDKRYTVYVDNIQIDIKITTCYGKVTINNALFKDLETLDGLRKYFNNYDNIQDGMRCMRYQNNDINSDSDEEISESEERSEPEEQSTPLENRNDMTIEIPHNAIMDRLIRLIVHELNRPIFEEMHELRIGTSTFFRPIYRRHTYFALEGYVVPSSSSDGPACRLHRDIRSEARSSAGSLVRMIAANYPETDEDYRIERGTRVHTPSRQFLSIYRNCHPRHLHPRTINSQNNTRNQLARINRNHYRVNRNQNKYHYRRY